MSFDMCFFYWYGRYCLQSKVCKQIEIGKEENIVYNKRKKKLFTDLSRATQARQLQGLFA